MIKSCGNCNNSVGTICKSSTDTVFCKKHNFALWEPGKCVLCKDCVYGEYKESSQVIVCRVVGYRVLPYSKTDQYGCWDGYPNTKTKGVADGKIE